LILRPASDIQPFMRPVIANRFPDEWLIIAGGPQNQLILF